jgi:hypothetical protein
MMLMILLSEVLGTLSISTKNFIIAKRLFCSQLLKNNIKL